MGVKRPLEEESLPELSLKQHKQFDTNKELTLVGENFPSHKAAPEGEAKRDICKSDYDGVPDNDAFIADKEVEAIEEDVDRGYLDFDMPWRAPQSSDDPYIYLLNIAPQKEITIGPEHQAEVPKWDPSASTKDFSGSNNSGNNDQEHNILGTCIIPMPDLNDSTNDGFTVGCSRTSDCCCLDVGSMRCVQYHVREAREKLRDAIGDETFTKLGFYEMGEERSSRWKPKDQLLFQQVVFSNSGRDFWKLLGCLFPTRRKKELVSYYFNVFMLRRRAYQNRSPYLEINSDHDEPKDVPGAHQQNRPSVDVDAKNDNELQQVNEDSHLTLLDVHSKNDIETQEVNGDYRLTLVDVDAKNDNDVQQVSEDSLVSEGGEESEAESLSSDDSHLSGGEEDSVAESYSDQGLDAICADEDGSGPEDVGGDEGTDDDDSRSDGNIVEKDGACDGNFPKQGVVGMDGGEEQVYGKKTA